MNYMIAVIVLFFITSQASDTVSLRITTQDQKSPVEYITFSQEVAPVLYDVVKRKKGTEVEGRKAVDMNKIDSLVPENISTQQGVAILKQFVDIYPFLKRIELPNEAWMIQAYIMNNLEVNTQQLKEEYVEKLVNLIVFADYVRNQTVLPILSGAYVIEIMKEPIFLLKTVQLPLDIDRRIAEALIQDVTSQEAWHPFYFSQCGPRGLKSSKPEEEEKSISEWKQTSKNSTQEKIKAGIKVICISYHLNPDKRFVFDALYFNMMIKDAENSLKWAELQKQVMGEKLYTQVSDGIKNAMERVVNPYEAAMRTFQTESNPAKRPVNNNRPLHLRAYDWVRLTSYGTYNKLNSWLNSLTRADIKRGMGIALLGILYTGAWYYFKAPQYDRLSPNDQWRIRLYEKILPRMRK